MDRCSRWICLGDAIAFEIAVPPDLPIVFGVRPRVPRIWETCPVCGHVVAPYPEWTAQIVYEDGVALFFDGAKDLFTFLLSPQRSISESGTVPIAGIFVTSYSTRAVIDARDAFFVVGSDVLGPGGEELVAHGSVGEAREFSRDHGGTRVIGFEELSTSLLVAMPGGAR